MPLDDIWIPLPHQRDEFGKHRFLLRFVFRVIDHEDFLPPRTVAQGNGQERIFQGVRHRTVRSGEGFDIDLHAPQLLEGHALEKGAPAGQQVLVRQIVEREEFAFVGRLRLGEGRHIVEGHGKLELPRSRQFPQLTRQRLHGPGERLVLRLLNQGFVSLAPVNLHPIRRAELDRHNPLGRVGPEQHWILLNHYFTLPYSGKGGLCPPAPCFLRARRKKYLVLVRQNLPTT